MSMRMPDCPIMTEFRFNLAHASFVHRAPQGCLEPADGQLRQESSGMCVGPCDEGDCPCGAPRAHHGFGQQFKGAPCAAFGGLLKPML